MNKQTLVLVYIRSSKYDDNGYPIRYWRGVLPSNTLWCLKALSREVADSGVLGPDVDVQIQCFDDTVERIPVNRIIRLSRRPNTRVLVGLAGVQSNQFARATDLALTFREADIPVMIGGFHVSGMLAMFDEPTPELQRLLDAGVSLIKGEAESPGAMETILKDALAGTLNSIYDFHELPCLLNAPLPRPEPHDLRRFFTSNMATFDTSRGCPFNCSFCTIINVQGRKMRHRSAACVLHAVETCYADGIDCFFFTDDNFSRNPAWEAIFDGLIEMRKQGKPVQFMMQIDTVAYRIPGFVKKAAEAGCYRVFIGMESLNPENLAAAQKNQNHVSDYANMVQTWREAEVLVYTGYIIGFPYDTPESVRANIETLCHEVKPDKAAFFMLTPLPGSRDHRDMIENAIPLDADYNNYDSVHETFRHPNFKPGEWAKTYFEAWETFYGKENIVRGLLRSTKRRYWGLFWTFAYFRYCVMTRSHPMLTGLFPLKGFRRRPGYPRERLSTQLIRRTRDLFTGARTYCRLFIEFQEIWMLTRKPADPRWTVLAELRERWDNAKSRIAAYSLGGTLDATRDELHAMLTAAAARLRKLSEGPITHASGLKTRLRAKAQEIETYVRNFERQTPTRRQIAQAEKFITDGILTAYEELAIRYVAKRRRVNAFRAEFVQRIKSGHIWTLDVLDTVKACWFELAMGARFLLSAIAGGRNAEI